MTTPPEADLEAHLGAQLPKIFPHIPPGDIDHQTHLVLRFGRNEITVNGETKWKKEGRADIVLNHKGKPIAVIELNLLHSASHDDRRVRPAAAISTFRAEGGTWSAAAVAASMNRRPLSSLARPKAAGPRSARRDLAG
jgi:hypothetical protein